MGVGSVSSVVLGYLLLLCLERSKVYWEGTGLLLRHAPCDMLKKIKQKI